MGYKISQYYQSRFMSGKDLEGQAMSVEIARVVEEQYYNRNSRQYEKDLVAYFTGREQGLLLKTERAKVLAAMFGEDTDDWLGKRIALVSKPRNIGGEIKDVIHIRPETKQTETDPEAIPF